MNVAAEDQQVFGFALRETGGYEFYDPTLLIGMHGMAPRVCQIVGQFSRPGRVPPPSRRVWANPRRVCDEQRGGRTDGPKPPRRTSTSRVNPFFKVGELRFAEHLCHRGAKGRSLRLR